MNAAGVPDRDGVRAALADVGRRTRELREAEKTHRDDVAAVVRELRATGISQRDVAFMLGISHQRVSQIEKAAE